MVGWWGWCVIDGGLIIGNRMISFGYFRAGLSVIKRVKVLFVILLKNILNLEYIYL